MCSFNVYTGMQKKILMVYKNAKYSQWSKTLHGSGIGEALRLAPPLYDARVILFEFINNACAYVNKFTYSYMHTYYESSYYSSSKSIPSSSSRGATSSATGTGGGSCPPRRNASGV